jgi:hypothetical protein
MGRSEERHSIFGDYTVHLDDDGNEVGRSEERHSIFGDYTQHYDADGNKAGTSEERHSICGDYIQHYDADGDKAGPSEERESICGDYTQHFDADGDKAGRSEHRSSFLAGDRVEHDGRFNGIPLAETEEPDDGSSEIGDWPTSDDTRDPSSEVADSDSSTEFDNAERPTPRPVQSGQRGGDAAVTPALDATTIRLLKQIEGKTDHELDAMMHTYPLPENALVTLVCFRLTVNKTYNLCTLLMLAGGCSNPILTYECARRLRDLGQCNPILGRRIARARRLDVGFLSVLSDTDPELVEWEKREILHEAEEAQRVKDHEEWKRRTAPPTFLEFIKRGLGLTSSWRR